MAIYAGCAGASPSSHPRSLRKFMLAAPFIAEQVDHYQTPRRWEHLGSVRDTCRGRGNVALFAVLSNGDI
jgi:hypothetical protein